MNEFDPVKPKRKYVKHAQTVVPTLSAAPLSEQEIDSEFINSVLAASLNQFKEVVDKQFASYKTDMNKLETITREYLDDFLIIGHTPDDKRVVLRYAATPKSYDALQDLTKKFLIKMMMEERLDV